MSYAIFSTGGKQYRVQPGDEILVEKLSASPLQNLTFDQVYLLVTDSALKLGHPLVKDVKVEAQVLSQEKSPKIRIATYTAKSRYRQVKGHRQPLTRVKITAIH